MHRIAFLTAYCLASSAGAQALVTEPNGTVTGVFLGKEIALDVSCKSNPLSANEAEVTTHSPLSQSLIDDVTEDAIAINMFNNAATFLANIDGEVFIAVNPKFGVPEFPVSTSGDDFDIVITCPAEF